MVALPSFFLVKSFDWVSQRDVMASESRDKKIIQRVRRGHRWDSRMRLDVKPWDARQARAFLFMLQQQGETVEYTDADWRTEITGRTATGMASGGVSFIINDDTDIAPGLMFNFANHSKLYMITSVSGTSINFMPEFEGVAEPTGLVFDSPVLTSELAPDLRASPEYAKRLSRDLSRINLRLVEATA